MISRPEQNSHGQVYTLLRYANTDIFGLNGGSMVVIYDSLSKSRQPLRLGVAKAHSKDLTQISFRFVIISQLQKLLKSQGFTIAAAG
mmetsp:Transcript_5943/g.15795  ORF Transcript_5943/g.15795 Transcript_5943/m.15795 type:complete len:87 (+) Transcript_5943:1413-1673(+)